VKNRGIAKRKRAAGAAPTLQRLLGLAAPAAAPTTVSAAATATTLAISRATTAATATLAAAAAAAATTGESVSHRQTCRCQKGERKNKFLHCVEPLADVCARYVGAGLRVYREVTKVWRTLGSGSRYGGYGFQVTV
jgi:hypothetical protein